jgi:LytS/YehU family sensor histidine kinase
MRDKRRLKQKLTEQRLISLINQINPHFLFNSLNTIRGMVFENEKNAVELISQLSNLFRYNLASNKTGITVLREELAVCEQYLAIEEIRLGDRLQIEFAIAPQTREMEIPTMSLLTLTENAIKHGIAKLKSGGILIIKSELIDNKLTLSVGNPYDVKLVESGTQIGLDNLKQRIELMYGSQGKVIQNSSDGYFQVQLIIPAQVMVTDESTDISFQSQDVQTEVVGNER